MADSLSIQSATLNGIAGIPPVAFQLLTSTAATSNVSLTASSSILVEVSGTGRLLSSLSAFRNDLQALPTTGTAADPASALATAQGLVAAVNGLQASTTTLQPVFDTLAGNSLTTQFALTLNQLVTNSVSAGNADLGSLQSIGITVQATATSPTLLIDQAQLNAAANADPAATQALLAGVGQRLIAVADTVESQVAGATASLANLTLFGNASGSPLDLSTLLDLPTTSTVQGIGVTTDLLQNLSADTLANALPLADLDLAAAGTDAEIVLNTSTALRDSQLAQLLAADIPVTIDEDLLTAATLGAAGIENPLTAIPAPATGPTPGAIPTAAPAAAPPVATPTVATSALNATAVANPPPVATAAADSLAADREIAEERIALQALLSDPSLRAFDNQFDPLYSALIAASHLSDFVAPDLAAVNPKALVTDDPVPVLAAPVARGLAYYNEAAGETWKQFTPNWGRLHWFA